MKKVLFSMFLFACVLTFQSKLDAYIIDHNCTDIDKILISWLQKAKADFRIGYSHTSHGSQLISGINALEKSEGSSYSFTSSDWGPKTGVFINDSWANDEAEDLGHNGDSSWEEATIDLLNRSGNDRNVIIWSWCGGVSDNSMLDALPAL